MRLARLDGAPMVAHPPICDQVRMEQALARRGVRPHIVCRTAGNETVLSMVRAGMGSAILPQLAVHSADIGSDASLCVHELRPAPPPREIFLLWQARRTHSPLTARAIEIAVEIAGNIAERG
ncbi:LysR family transcriptional regulator substrate-binding protein [Streptomyces sp. B21-083]|uniref:LysR family transcriptional regulator substrate-binding protein n=1 Tax=Streptomyces sp. B21-083 TaxID=3039410 RepID=UPI002FEFE141